MTLTTHAIIGGTLAGALAPNPVVAVAVAFLSHFALDAIPHWDYQLQSNKNNGNSSPIVDLVMGRGLIVDLAKVGFDLILGLTLVYVLYHSYTNTTLIVILLGAVAAVCPDIIQAIYGKARLKSLGYIQSVHNFFHTHQRLDGRPVLGILTQGLFVVIFLWISKTLGM